jgi:Condensation domain
MTSVSGLDSAASRAEQDGAGAEKRRASRARLDSMSAVKRELFAKRLSGRLPAADRSGTRSVQARELTHKSGPQVWSSSLSASEERFWMTYMLEDRSSAYHLPATLRLTGPLDVSALEKALRTVIARHDILRTRYPVSSDGELTAVVDELRECTLGIVVADNDPQDFLSAASAEPFDLESGPLIRPLLLRTNKDEHYFHATLLHIIADGWSIGNFLSELTAVYNACKRGVIPALPELTMQYRDYALQQRARVKDFRPQVEYWQCALSGVPGELGLPTDRPRRLHSKVPGRDLILTFPKGPASELARNTRTTLYMVLLAAYSTVLGHRAGSEDVVVGTPVAGRHSPDTEPLIGCFINTLVMRTDLSGDPTFRELLARVRGWMLRAYDNQDVPFQEVSAHVGVRPDVRNTLIQAWMTLQNFPDWSVEMADLGVEVIPLTTDETKFDITFNLAVSNEDMELEVKYDSSIFDEKTVHSFAREFIDVLEIATDEPNRRLSEIIEMGSHI